MNTWRSYPQQTGLLAKGRAQRPCTSMHVHTDRHEQQRHTQIIYIQRDRHTRTHGPLQMHIQTIKTTDMQQHMPSQSEVCIQEESCTETHAPLTKLNASDILTSSGSQTQSSLPPLPRVTGAGDGDPEACAHTRTHTHTHTHPSSGKVAVTITNKTKTLKKGSPRGRESRMQGMRG